MKYLFTLLFLGGALSGCASMTKAEIDKPGVAGAKKVAIVGFHMLVQEPKSIIGDLKAVGDLAKGKVRDANEQHDTADEVYRVLSQRLGGDMNWQMLPADQVSRSTSYKAIVSKYTTGVQVGPMVPNDMHKIRPHNMIDADPFIYKVTEAEREALMHELGVDAVVVDFELVGLKNESWFGGMIGRAKYNPRVQNIIRVYVRGRKDPVWFDTWAWGEGDKALQAELNSVEDKPLLEQVVIASRKSIGETLSRYKSY